MDCRVRHTDVLADQRLASWQRGADPRAGLLERPCRYAEERSRFAWIRRCGRLRQPCRGRERSEMRARHAWYLRAGYLFGLPETLYFLYVCSSRTVKIRRRLLHWILAKRLRQWQRQHPVPRDRPLSADLIANPKAQRQKGGPVTAGPLRRQRRRCQTQRGADCWVAKRSAF